MKPVRPSAIAVVLLSLSCAKDPVGGSGAPPPITGYHVRSRARNTSKSTKRERSRPRAPARELTDNRAGARYCGVSLPMRSSRPCCFGLPNIQFTLSSSPRITRLRSDTW
jgi:hypothetical protein